MDEDTVFWAEWNFLHAGISWGWDRLRSKPRRRKTTRTIFYMAKYQQSQPNRRTCTNGAWARIRIAKTERKKPHRRRFMYAHFRTHRMGKTTISMGNWRQPHLFHVYPHAMMMRISRYLQVVSDWFAIFLLSFSAALRGLKRQKCSEIDSFRFVRELS